MTDEIEQLLNHQSLQLHRGDEMFTDDEVQVSKKLKAYYYVFKEMSPYEEVRASVTNTDDPNIPVETFRAIFLAMTLGGLFTAANQVLPKRCNLQSRFSPFAGPPLPSLRSLSRSCPIHAV
jgi:hypothetical protein